MPDVSAYLNRIMYNGPLRPDLATLNAIVLCHAQAIPFENLDQLTGRLVSLDGDALEAKLVHGRRGGYCFEHGHLLRQVLQAIGFGVTGLEGRVRWGRPAGGEPPGRGHMLLMVDLEDGPSIVDVGFGNLTLTAALTLRAGVQQTPHGRFRLVRCGGEYLLEADTGRGWSGVYTFDLRPASRADYDVSNWYLCTHPASLFTTRLMGARATADGRMTLNDFRFRVRRNDGYLTERRLAGAEEIMSVLRNELLIDLADIPGLESALDQLTAEGGVR
jgi:N-hydroxyarylamine O-acetyltransferase